MSDKVYFRGPLFEFSASGRFAITAAVLLILLMMILLLVRGHLF